MSWEGRLFSKWDHEFESAFLLRGVLCEPDFRPVRLYDQDRFNRGGKSQNRGGYRAQDRKLVIVDSEAAIDVSAETSGAPESLIVVAFSS